MTRELVADMLPLPSIGVRGESCPGYGVSLDGGGGGSA